AAAPDIVIVGRIRGPYGIQGWVHVQAFTEPKENLRTYRPWLLAAPGPGSEAPESPDWRSVAVAKIRPHKQDFIARLDGVVERNGAEALKGSWIGVNAELLPPPAEEEYYWRDLIGATVANVQGEVLGQVRDLLETGAHDVLVIEPEGQGREALLIPFHDQYLKAVDLASRRISVAWDFQDDGDD
ncbi:MAG: ribosome maturation factor RimM, partial [Pseudomonadota bacterium]